MAWRRIGDKPLHEPMLSQLIDAYMRRKGFISTVIEHDTLWDNRFIHSVGIIKQ